MSVSSWQTETKFNRRDALVALAVALVAAVTALLFYLPKTQSGHLTAVITQHGQVVRRMAVSGMDKEQVIELDDGTYHLTVRVSADGAYVSHSDCPTQDCVHTGVIRRAGQSIVCLPAQVVVYLEGTPAAGQPDVIVG